MSDRSVLRAEQVAEQYQWLWQNLMMEIDSEVVTIETAGGAMPAFVCAPAKPGRRPAVLLLMEAFGLTDHIRNVARRIAAEGYVTLVPDLYWRDLPNNKFGYDQVAEGVALMRSLDHDAAIADIRAAITCLKARRDVAPSAVGVTGFCMGGGFSFRTACRLSSEVAAVAPFYGMVSDEWIEEVEHISVPIYLFYGGADPYIPPARIQQIEARFAELGKPYQIKTYADADHGFFCDERGSYSRHAAEDSWRELSAFFALNLVPAANLE